MTEIRTIQTEQAASQHRMDDLFQSLLTVHSMGSYE